MNRWGHAAEHCTVMVMSQPDIVLRVDVHAYVRWSGLRGFLLSSVALVSCLRGF